MPFDYRESRLAISDLWDLDGRRGLSDVWKLLNKHSGRANRWETPPPLLATPFAQALLHCLAHTYLLRRLYLALEVYH